MVFFADFAVYHGLCESVQGTVVVNQERGVY